MPGAGLVLTPSVTAFRWTGVGVYIFAMLVAAQSAFGHGGGNWNAFRIDRVTDDAYDRVVEAQAQIGNIISQRTRVDEWPAPALKHRRDELIGLKDEMDEILEHFILDGLNIDHPDTRRAEPRVGRSLAASKALNAVIALLNRALDSEDQSAFVAEFYGGGPAAWMYESIDSNLDRMVLYSLLFEDRE